MAITTREGKGSALTHSELDANFETLDTGQTAASIKSKLSGLTGSNRLDASAIKNLPEGGGGGDMTGAEIKTALEGLSGDNRLDASAIKNLPEPEPGEQGPQGQPGMVFIVPDGVPPDKYDTFDLGVAATSDGDLFGVISADEKTIVTYRNEDGEGVYQRTDNWIAAIDDYDFRRNSIVYGTVGKISTNAVLDYDTSQILKAGHKVRNLASNVYPDERFIGNDLQIAVAVGASKSDGAPDANGGTTGIEVTFPAAATIGDQPPFISFKNDALRLPTGQWTLAFDIRLPDGTVDKTMHIRDSAVGSTWTTKLITDEWQTIHLTIVVSEDERTLGSFTFMIQPEIVTPNDLTVVYLCNQRVVAGAVPLDKVVQLAIEAPNLKPKLAKYTDKMVMDMDSFGQLLKCNFIEPKVFTAATLAVALKLTDQGVSNRTMLMTYITDADAVGYINLLNGRIKDEHGLFSNITGGGEIPLDRWVVIVIAADDRGAQVFLNGVEFLTSTTANTPKTLKSVELFGITEQDFAINGKVSGLSLWDRRLGKAEIIKTSDTLISRLLVKDENVLDIKTFMIFEGDSNTSEATNYVKNTADKFSPMLLTRNFSVGGARIGSAGDPESENTVYGRQAKVLASVKENVDAGRVTIFSAMIGTNDLLFITDSDGAIAFYNKYMLYLKSFRDIGARVIACTILDRNDGVISDETYLNQINTLIRSDDAKYDALCDFNADSRLNPATPTYFYDGLHWTELGTEVAAEIMEVEINKFWVE